MAKSQAAAGWTAGSSTGSSLPWWFYAWIVWDQDQGLSMTGLVLAVLAVVVPLAAGGWWLSRCSAWRTDETGRCRQPRAGLLKRCQSHRSQWVTVYDVAGASACLLAALNAAIVAAAFWR